MIGDIGNCSNESPPDTVLPSLQAPSFEEHMCMEPEHVINIMVYSGRVPNSATWKKKTTKKVHNDP